jgi:hypothetical protein
MKTEKKHNKMNNNKIIIIVNTRPKASGSSSRFQGGGVTGKGQYRDKIGTSRDKTPVGKGRWGVREHGLRHLKALKV